MTETTIRYTPEIILAHIDMTIHHWRSRLRDTAPDSLEQVRCACYVDAYQSMRSTLFGELLPLDDWQKK